MLFRILKQMSMKITLLQLNPTIGDLKGNAKIIAELCAEVGAPIWPSPPSWHSWVTRLGIFSSMQIS